MISGAASQVIELIEFTEEVKIDCNRGGGNINMHLRQTFRAIHFNEAYLLISNSGVRINCQPRHFLSSAAG